MPLLRKIFVYIQTFPYVEGAIGVENKILKEVICMGKIMTKSQRRAAHRKKALKIGIPSFLAVVLLVCGVFAATKFFGGKDAKDDVVAELDQLGNNDKTEEPEDDLRVFFSDEYKENAYGIRKKQNIPISMFPENYNERKHLSGGNDEAVSIPLPMDQQKIDVLKRSMSGTALNNALDELYKENKEELMALPLAEQKECMLEEKATEFLCAAYGYAWVQEWRKSWPELIEQNPQLGEFENQVKEAMSRKPEDGKPVGWSAFMTYENAAAKAAGDHSRMVMCTKTDEEAGTYNYYDTYCLLNEIFKQLLSYEGIQSLESTRNWKLPLTVDFETMMTVESNEQENLPAAIWVHRTKMSTITAKYGTNMTDRRPEAYEKKATPIPEDPKPTPKDNPGPGDTPKPDPDPDKYPATLIHYDVETGATLDTEGLGNFKVGVTVTGNSKSIANYTAMKDSVSGEMVKGGLTLRIPYKKNGTDPKVYPATLVHYDVDTGKTMATEDLGDYAIGVKVTGNAKAFAGYTVATTAPVSGNMKEGGITLKIGYKKTPDPKTYPATLIHYDVDTGVTLDTESLGSFEVGVTVTGNAKSFANYAVATKAPVSDSMKEGGLTLRIGYKKNDPPVAKKYPATLIHYDKESGATLRTDSLGNFEVGTTVTGRADSFTGYTADISSTSGVMVEGGLTLRIPYTPKHDGDGQKDPEADPENKPGYDPGIGDNDPDDGKGDDQEEKPAETDKENGGTEQPGENQNNDGSDSTKPATPQITDKVDGVTTEDENGNQTEIDKEPENGNKVDDSDVKQYSEGSKETAPAAVEPVQQETATEVEAVESVQEKKEAPAPEPVVVEAPAPAPAEQKAEPAEEAPAQESEADGAGEFQEDCP